MEEVIRKIVHAFAAEMNEWEHKMYLLSRLEDGKVLNHESDRLIVPSVCLNEYKNVYYEIFNKYCTNKVRKYSGFPNSWARHGKYKGIEDDGAILSVSFPKANRSEVVTIGSGIYTGNFMFILLKKSHVWLIDSMKYRFSQKDEWQTHHF